MEIGVGIECFRGDLTIKTVDEFMHRRSFERRGTR